MSDVIWIKFKDTPSHLKFLEFRPHYWDGATKSYVPQDQSILLNVDRIDYLQEGDFLDTVFIGQERVMGKFVGQKDTP